MINIDVADPAVANARPVKLGPRDAGATAYGSRAYRVAECAIALVALTFLAPLCLIVALAIKAQDGGPVIFAHRRIGLGARTFSCLKFRSMAIDADARLQRLLEADPDARREWEQDHKLKRDPRITRLGRFLRQSSLDEVPQLINVLRGEMSLVGPRPIVQAEIGRYGRRFAAYCSVRPGITGLWQVNGRNNVTYQRRVALDTLYAQNRTVLLDLKILAATIPAVMLRRGSY